MRVGVVRPVIPQNGRTRRSSYQAPICRAATVSDSLGEGTATKIPHAPQFQPVAAPRCLITAALLVAMAIGFLYATLATSDRPTLAVVWGGLALASYAAGLLFLAGGRLGNGLGLNRWSFGSWTLFWYGTAFGLATLTWSQPQTGTPAQIAIFNVLRALWLVAVGMTVWAIGYFVGPGQLVRGLTIRAVDALGRRFTGEVRSASAPWILYAIGIAGRLASIATTGRFGYVGDAASVVSTATGYGQVLSLLSLCAPLAVSAAALQVYRERLPGARITMTVLFLSELAFGAAAGGKQNFVIAVLAVAIPFSATNRRLPKVALMGVTLVFLIVVIPFNHAYREVARSGSNELAVGAAVAAAPTILKDTVTNNSIVTALPGSVDYLLQRIREIDSPAIIIQRTPGQVGYLNPVQLVEAPVAEVVPRAIWPSKPIVTVGYRISQDYYGFSSNVYTSSAVTPVGGLYMYGGWIPVIAGMLVLGCGVRLLDEILDVRANPHAVFLVLLLFPTLVKNEVDWVSLLAGIPGTVAVWLLAVRLTFRQRSSK
jgi:hypothetical protein